MSLSAHQIRCSCGWLINLQLIDEESIIYLYDLVNWVSRVKYEFGELRNFHHVIGLYCKKCKRIMLLAKEQKYVAFSLTSAYHCMPAAAVQFRCCSNGCIPA